MDESKFDLNKRVEDALEVIRLAERTAKFVAKNDYRFSGLNVAAPSHVVLLRDKPRLISMTCVSAKETPFVAVFNKALAKEIARQMLECVDIIEKLEAEEEKDE